jgi:hypothetical protein
VIEEKTTTTKGTAVPTPTTATSTTAATVTTTTATTTVAAAATTTTATVVNDDADEDPLLRELRLVEEAAAAGTDEPDETDRFFSEYRNDLGLDDLGVDDAGVTAAAPGDDDMELDNDDDDFFNDPLLPSGKTAAASSLGSNSNDNEHGSNNFPSKLNASLFSVDSSVVVSERCWLNFPIDVQKNPHRPRICSSVHTLQLSSRHLRTVVPVGVARSPTMVLLGRARTTTRTTI